MVTLYGIKNCDTIKKARRWLEANNIDYKEQNVSFMEPQNWIKKGGLFLKRKFFK